MPELPRSLPQTMPLPVMATTPLLSVWQGASAPVCVVWAEAVMQLMRAA